MPELSIMIKPASSLCNLRCKYCFYHDVSQIREEHNLGIMSAETSDRLIKSALSFAEGDSVAFAFQGGEPLLAGIDYFKDFSERVKKYNLRGSRIFFSIQTNGLLIDEQWARFFHDEHFLVGLSLDGDMAANRFRVDANGTNRFYKILNAAQMLTMHEVDFNILTVLTGYAAENIDRIYSFFKRKGFKYLQFIPCLRPFGDKSESELYMTNEQYAYFLIHLFNAYVKDYVRGEYMSIRQFDNWVQMYVGRQPEQCGVCGHCMHQFVVEGNGNVYPCDFYCLDEWLLGNINSDELEAMANSKKAADFIRESLSGFEVSLALGFDFFFLCFDLFESDSGSRCGKSFRNQVISSISGCDMHGLAGKTEVLNILQKDQIHRCHCCMPFLKSFFRERC